MTLQMWIAVGVLIVMIVLIMMDLMPFGAPPIFACILLVILGQSTISEAFVGFSNSSVIMIACFMVVLAAVQKTNFMAKIKNAMVGLIKKGGYKSFALLVIVVMLGASLVGGGNTGYYVLILSLIASIPYMKSMPTSKLMAPLGFATNMPLIPFNVALYYGVASSVLQTAGYTETVSMMSFAIVNFIMGIGFLIWTLVSYKLLPDFNIQQRGREEGSSEFEQDNLERAEKEAKQEESEGDEIMIEDSEDNLSPLSKNQETITVVCFIISVIGMMLLNVLGDAAYAIPGLAAFILLWFKVVDFKEFRENFFAPVILMMAGVIGVADALANSGFTDMIGQMVANLGGGLPPFVLVLIFGLLTSTCATFTGSNMGSVYIFAPIAIATFMNLGLNPLAVASAVCISGWQGGYMPIDGMPAMIMGMGHYKLPEFWTYTVPMYLVREIFLCVGATIIFPM